MKSNLKSLYMRILYHKDKPISQSTTHRGDIIIKFAVKRIEDDWFDSCTDTVVLYNIPK